MIKFTEKGIYCVPGRFYIDPWKPVARAVITHGHADHARWGMDDYLCHTHTVPILKSRIGPAIRVEGIEYGTKRQIGGVTLSLHPAGHIPGSAQIRLEYRGRIVVISGDYKLQDDGLSAPFELVKCHEFVTESTFGLPIYRWAPVSAQYAQLIDWVAQNQQHGKTSVFVGYSLGKAQRLMKALEGVAPLYVHDSIGKINEAFESVGIRLPSYQVVDLRGKTTHLQNSIVIVPPSLLDSQVIRRIPHRAEAFCSGWMMVRGARRWRSADAGFPISDHADWSELLKTVRETGAERVYVTHGQTAVFARYLNEIGIHAEEVPTAFRTEDTIDETTLPTS